MTSTVGPRIPIIIDTDPGIDDVMALALALLAPQLEIVGLTTVFGNADIDTTTRNAGGLLALFERADISVARGAGTALNGVFPGGVAQVHGRDGVGDADGLPDSKTPVDPRDATQFLIETINAAVGEITLVTLGPLTNIAHALAQDPMLDTKVKGVVVMGGNAFVPGNASPTAEANVLCDPEAADIVFGARWPVRMIGLDATHQIIMPTTDIDRMAALPGGVGRIFERCVPHYRDFYRKTNGIDGVIVHDPAVIASLIMPDAIGWVRHPLRVETQGISRGKTWPAMGGTDDPVPEAWRNRPDIAIATTCNSSELLALMMRVWNRQPV